MERWKEGFHQKFKEYQSIKSIKTNAFLCLIKNTVIDYYSATMNLYLHIYKMYFHGVFKGH